MTSNSQFLVSGFEDGSDIDEEREPEDDNAKHVLRSAQNGDLDRLKLLLELDPSLIHTRDKEGYTALHRACYSNHSEVVKFLLGQGADIDAKTELLWTPLHSCCRWNSREAACILIAEGADVNARSEGGQTPLHIAATHGACYDLVQLLLMHPFIQPDLRNNSNETAAVLARRCSKYYNIFDMADPLINCIDFD